jgi:hypothetical protein
MGLDMPAKLLPVLEEAAVTPVVNGLRQRCLHRQMGAFVFPPRETNFEIGRRAKFADKQQL